MTDSLSDTFASHDTKNLIPYLCAGDPDLELSLKLARAIETAGADILEFGIPFSDPLADGPTIQKATQRSLENDIHMNDIFDLLRDFRSSSDLPVVFMSYYNPIFRYGEDQFISEAVEAGADGVIVVDLPPEEGIAFFEKAPQAGLDTVLLATPTTDTERIRDLSQISTGFLYYVMVTGVTGVRAGYDERLAEEIKKVGEISNAPTVMGFGVSDIKQIKQYLDPIHGVVVGSHVIDGIEQNLGNEKAMIDEVQSRVSRMADDLNQFSKTKPSS